MGVFEQPEHRWIDATASDTILLITGPRWRQRRQLAHNLERHIASVVGMPNRTAKQT